MAPKVMTNVGLWLGGHALAGVSNQVAFDFSADELDATTWNDDGRSYLLGGKTPRVEFTGFYDPETHGALMALQDLNGGIVSIAPDGQAAGSLIYAFPTQIASLSRGAQWGELLGAELSAVAAKGATLIRGVIGQINPNLTATGAGAVQNLGALPAGKTLFAGLHVFSAGGTNPSVTMSVQSAAASGFASPTTRLTLPAMNAVGSVWGTPVKGPVGTDAFWRVNLAVSGTSPAFSVLAFLAIQ